MGTLRILLALWVAAAHGRSFAGPEAGSPWVAVQCAFIISGFYMSLVLNEKYTGPGSLGRFLSQRLWRLFPGFWAVLLLTLAAGGAAWGWWGGSFPPLDLWRNHHLRMDGAAKGLLAAANGLLVGTNEAYFLGFDPTGRSLRWTAHLGASDLPAWPFLALPQAWAIELALLFSIAAPWIVRRSLAMVGALLLASLAVRLVCTFGFQLTFDPWTHRFFPSELAFFLLGSIAYKIYRAPWRERAAEGLWVWPLFALLFAATIAFPFIPLSSHLKAWAYYGLATVTLPFLFAETKNWRWDRWLGELSYPVYLIHFLVIWIGQAALPASAHARLGGWAVLGSLAASIALHHGLLAPIKTWRTRRTRPSLA